MIPSIFIRLLGENKERELGRAVRDLSEARRNIWTHTLISIDLIKIPAAPFAYWVSENFRRLFVGLPRFSGNDRILKQGLATADDFRFLRVAWETPKNLSVSPDQVWFSFAKGGSYSPFYSDIFLNVNWWDDGKEIRFFGDPNGIKPLSRPQNTTFYFRSGLTWPLRTNGLSFRCLPAGCVFGHKGPAAFVDSDSSEQLLALCAIVNSSVFGVLVDAQLARVALAQSFEVGLISSTPIPTQMAPGLTELALAAWTAKRRPDTANLTSHAFLRPVLGQPGSSLGEGTERWSSLLNESAAALSAIRSEIDEVAYRLYGLGEDDRRGIEKTMGSSESSEEDSTCASGEDEEDEDSPAASASGPALVSELFDYVFGCAFGRWDIRYATGERQSPDLPDPFDPLPICPPGMLQNVVGLPAESKDVPADYPLPITWSGILVDDANHPEDIIGRVREAIRVIWGDRADDIETEACEILDVRAKPKENLDALRIYLRDPNRFFKSLLARYSKSRRKAPIYWPLSTDSGSYTLWIYYHRLDSQTLYTCVSEFIDPKREVLGRDLEVLGRRIGTGGSTEERQQLDELTTFLTELKTLRDRLLEVAGLPYRPNLNDGVQITAAPLWKCFRHSPWQKVLKDTWKELEKGKYNWAHLALPIWPGGVVPLCAKDRSLAIAHGLEDLLWVPDLSAKKKDQLRPLKSPDDEIKELIKAGHNKKDIDRAAIDMQVAETLGLRHHLWVERPAGKWRRRLAPKEEMDAEVYYLKGR